MRIANCELINSLHPKTRREDLSYSNVLSPMEFAQPVPSSGNAISTDRIHTEKNVMKTHQAALPNTLRHAILTHCQTREEKGWVSRFILHETGSIAETAVMEAGGDSGDILRIATDFALLCCFGLSETSLDETKIGRKFVRRITQLERIPEGNMLVSDTVAFRWNNLSWSRLTSSTTNCTSSFRSKYVWRDFQTRFCIFPFTLYHLSHPTISYL